MAFARLVLAPLAALLISYAGLFALPAWWRGEDGTAARDIAAAAAHAKALRDLVGAGKWADALAPALALARAAPRNHIYQEQLASIYRHLDRPKDEAAAWEQFLTSSPSPSEACPHIGEAYRKAAMNREAADAFERCVTFDPTDPDSLFYAARAADWERRFDRARELYTRALAIDGRNLDVRIGLARLALHEEQIASALAQALFVLNEKADEVDALLIAGLASLRQGRLEAARGYLNRGLKDHARYADLHLALGMVEDAARRPDEARRQYERALALDPGREDIKARLARPSGPPR